MSAAQPQQDVHHDAPAAEGSRSAHGRLRPPKWFFLVSIVLGGVLEVVFAAMGGTMNLDVLVPSALTFIYLLVVSLILLHKAWNAIQDGHARTSPGKAVGLMLIPWFNFYWLFPGYWGFAKDYNAFLARHQITRTQAPPRVFLATCIMTLVSLFVATIPLPVVQLIAASVTVILWAVVTNTLCNAVNAVAQSSDR